MYRLITLLSIALVLFTNVLFAQNCPSSPTYKNVSTTINLSASGSSYVANDGKTYNVILQNGFSSTSTICVTNGSTVNLSFSTITSPVAGGTIYTDASSKLIFTGTDMSAFPFTINNYGTLTQNIDINYQSGAAISNYGTYNTSSDMIINTGVVTLNNSGTMTLSGSMAVNSQSFTLNNLDDGILTIKNSVAFNGSDISNKGTINFNGATTFNTVDFANSGYAYFNSGTVVINSGTLINYGLIDTKGDIVNNNCKIINYCTITTDGSFTHNNGSLTNYGSILLPVTGSNSFTVQGPFVNGTNGFVQGVDFLNNNKITGGGDFYFQRTTENNGTFSGTVTDNINFYDATGNNGVGNTKFFDIQNTLPLFTTKSKISSVSTTNLIACGDPAPPAITTQPTDFTLCDNSLKTATFTVAATSPYSSMTYQWRKNGTNIAGATSSSYTASNLTLADTANAYTVAITNSLGTTISNSASVNYIIVAQPAPASLYLATGSAATITIKTSGATAWQWKKNGTNIAGAVAPVYTDPSISLTEAGSYTTLVTYNGGTCTSSASTVTVENLPAITTQPQAQVLCSSTTSATFSVAATSTSTMNYQWYKGTVAITGATSASYAATGLTLADTANAYNVKITNGVGSTTSNTVGIKYLIVTQPTNQYVATGTSATFSVTASSVATGYQWQKNGANIAGATARTYTIAATKLTDAGNYTVIVSAGNVSCTSNAATLTVENPPVITTQPQTQVLCSGTTSATFSVTATSTSTMGYVWYKNGAIIPGATSSSYTATGLTAADTTNTYYVFLKNGVSSTTSNTVGVKYLIITQPVSQSVTTGGAVTFSVTASGVATGYQWQKNGVNITGATSRTYTIAAATSADAANYTVVVSSGNVSCTSNAATLTVLNLPNITTQPATVTLCDTATKTASLSVVATSNNGNMTYQWKKNGVNITGATSSSYTASNLTLADTASAYTVAVTNQTGTTVSNSASVHYVIIAEPSPASLYLATGSAATFTIKTSGATAWQWKKNGGNLPGATAPAYTDASVTSPDAGSYTTLVTYSGGTCTSSAATLTVENLPAITTQPQAQVLCSGTTSATFSVVATSTSTMSYQWYNNNVAINGATLSTYTANGLTLADTANAYSAKITNGVGTTTSNSVGIKYAIVTQPVSQSALTGTNVTFSITASSVVTGYKWQKDGKDVPGGNTRTLTINSIATTDAGNYTVIVNYQGGTCTSNAAALTVLSLPTITTQPQDADFCETSGIVSFNVIANSLNGNMTYQWKKNGANISGATGSVLQLSGLTIADTANRYTVAITNLIGTTISNAVKLNPVVTAQPASLVIATGNAANLSFTTIAGTSKFQWYKNNTAISKATQTAYKIQTVNLSDSGTYKATFTYSGGTCATTAAVLTPSITLYSKSTGSMNTPATWGVNTDGSGSTPVDFTRDEHTFIVANRSTLTNTADITIAGTLDLGNGTVSLLANSKVTIGRIIRSGSKGVIAASSTADLKLTGITTTAYAGASDLYFAAGSNTLGGLYTDGHTVNLRTALNLSAGAVPGVLQVNSGTFNTFDSLTLKSDSLSTAFVYTSAGVINGKVTVEKFIPSRRAWRFLCSPVAANGAPTINAAWQEGATSSTSNPHPGYGTHITYGAESDGYDQNPQKSFSMYVLRNGGWYGVPPTKTTKVTDYPAYMIFARGNRSYPITTTTNTTTPMSTILRTTGNLNQGTQPSITLTGSDYVLVGNPYASPIDFDVVAAKSTNIKKTARIWDPTLAGTKGVGAYVTVDWTSTGYITTPPSNVQNIIPAGQGFWVQVNDPKKTGTLVFDESDKYLPTVNNHSYNTFRMTNQEAMLEIDLKVFNDDGTTGIADGVLYHFSDDNNNDVDDNDITKLKNLYENLSINSQNTLLTVERRQAPLPTDTLQLSFTGSKSTNYQLQFVPKSFSNITVGNLYLYDRYLNTKTLLSHTDTTSITISINTADAASKDAGRFSIVGDQQVVLPVSFSSAKAYAKGTAVQVDWKVATEIEVAYYEVEKSANGTTFSKAGQVQANGIMSYSFSDAAPFSGTSYYRVKSVDKSGKVTYTKIMPVTINISNIASSLSIYPNPLKGKTFQVQLSNKAAGSYNLSVISSNGQQLLNQTINHNGGTASYTVTLNNSLASGVYVIKAVATDGTADTIKVIAE